MGKGGAGRAAARPALTAPAVRVSLAEALADLAPGRTPPLDEAAAHAALEALIDTLTDPETTALRERLRTAVPDATETVALTDAEKRVSGRILSAFMRVEMLVSDARTARETLARRLHEADLRGRKHERDEAARGGRALLADAVSLEHLLDPASGVPDEIAFNEIPMRTRSGREVTLIAKLVVPPKRQTNIPWQQNYNRWDWVPAHMRAEVKTLGEARQALKDGMQFVDAGLRVHAPLQIKGLENDRFVAVIYTASGAMASVKIGTVLVARRDLVELLARRAAA